MKLYEVESSSYPPQMEDPLQLPVGSVQEAVRSGRPLLIDGRHGRHVALQAQEVFLHLEEHRGKDTEGGFFFVCALRSKGDISSCARAALTILWMVKS